MDFDTQLKASLGDAYALERELGGGGMARVFLATEVALGRKARMGRRAESDSIRAELRRTNVDDRSRIERALAEAVMGDLDQAFAILQKRARWDVPVLIELRADPLLTDFRADPRYPQLLARIGLRP